MTAGHWWDVQDCRTLVGCSGLQDIGGMFRTAGGGLFRTAGHQWDVQKLQEVGCSGLQEMGCSRLHDIGGMFKTAGHRWDVQDCRT